MEAKELLDRIINRIKNYTKNKSVLSKFEVDIIEFARLSQRTGDSK